MNKWMMLAFAIALAAPVGGASAEPKDNKAGNDRVRDLMAQGIPPGEYKLEKRRGPPFPPPGPPPCASLFKTGDDCHQPGTPASR